MRSTDQSQNNSTPAETAITNAKFNTALNPFSKKYAENALLQKGFNPQIIADVVQYILRQYPEATSQPLSIADLCCGDGSATCTLLNALEKQAIQVKHMMGLDISSEQIARAQAYSAGDSRLTFKVQNIETLQAVDQYDVVISLFGLHWIEDLPRMAETIYRALKQGGLVVFFVPLEKNDFFALRQKLMATPEWQAHFNHFTIHPFIDSPAPYLTAFSPYFALENPQGISGDQPVDFTVEQFTKFLSSWMQEVRFLQDPTAANHYLNDLVKNIPPTQSLTADVAMQQVDNKQSIIFLERFFWFHGKKTAPTEPSTQTQHTAPIIKQGP